MIYSPSMTQNLARGYEFAQKKCQQLHLIRIMLKDYCYDQDVGRE
jgi:hypothetical protein